MIPYPSERILTGVITPLIMLCHATGLEAHAQAGPKRAAQVRAASRATRSQPKEGNERARALVEDGLRRADQKDWVAAVEAFGQALAISPQYGDAYIAMGDTYMDIGKYEEGFKAYRQAISVTPSNPDAHYSLGAAYNDMAQYGDSFKHFVQAIRLKPDFAEAHYGIGYAYLRLENYRDALVYLRRAVQIQPDYWEARLALGQTYLGLRDVKSAERELKLLAGNDASAAATLEKEIAGARGVAQPPDRGERDGRAESAPPPVKKSVTTNAEQEQASGDPVRPAAPNQGGVSTRPPTSVPRPTAPGGDAALTVELSFWDSIKNSRDPEEFTAYLNKYPEGQFAELAKIRMRALAGKKEEAPGGGSEPKPPPPADDAAVNATSTKPLPPTAAPDGIARQPKEQSAEEQPNKEQPLKEQPAADQPKPSGSAAPAAAETLEATLDSLRRLLPSKFSYRVRLTGNASEAATAEVSINYEPLKFEGCTVEWRDQKDTIRVSLSELDPEAVRVGPRSRPGTTFSIEVWDVSISAAGGKGAISEAKGDGSGTVNSYNGLDLQYDNRERAEGLARALRQSIKLCVGKP
ncbi:MAG TPA: tetratricopeptide repeat protein [Pyrinomonadaceae bacterium]|jgi:tetratricopeptide (TPR) repeat protein|nr:tetratricopeptide repeat protein [Pyrinomonadaceae bacterium]